MRRGACCAAPRLIYQDERRETQASDGRRGPGGGTNLLAYPQSAQPEAEDELGDEGRLHDGELAVVERGRLKDERRERGDPPEQPQPASQQRDYEVKARGPCRATAGTGEVLRR